ncbi:MAG TPA: zinc ribbon domain-containing protein [Pyrinomonadaceae bacterium]|nr:zinc ribbon domain-containing protein [Pyrinomonadaceae bacterium]
MFCPKCATQNAEEAKFCRGCGTDISLVPQAVSGALAERLADDDDSRRGRRRRRRGERRPPSIERGVKGLFMGLAFIFIAVIIMTRMPGGSVWGFWMFLPAAGMLADGISTLARLKEERRRLAAPQHQPTQAYVPPPPRASALPPRETGEIIAPPPSVTEGTTRHLGVPAERTRGDA